MAKVSSFVKLTAQPGKRYELADALRTMFPSVNDEAGTEVYSLNLDKGDDNVVWMFELYADDEALGAHGGSPAMASLIGQLGPLLDGAPMMAFAVPTDAKGHDV